MSWTSVFWYTALLLVISIIGRLFDVANATWQQHKPVYKVQDIFDVVLVAFGLIGLYGLAFEERYFSQQLWQAYFVLTMIYIPISFYLPKYTDMRAMYGQGNVIKAIASNTLLMAPSHVALYVYAFSVTW